MQKETILLVDDEASIIRALTRTLLFNGYTVQGTTNPREATQIMDSNSIAVLICDQRMPEMKGNEVLQYARQYHPNIVRILITGYADMESTIAAINDGQIFRYITKPWQDEELIQVVEKAIEYRGETVKKEIILNSFLTEKEDWKRTIDQMNLRLDNSMKGAIKALLKTVKIKDIELYQHSLRVEAYARQIAIRAGLPEQQANNLAHASLFHDIGKIAIRDKILFKQGPLNNMDVVSMRKHPVYGMEIISELGFLDDVADIILQHHEKIDGNGYPYGLKGDEIMLEAQILAVADVYDALVSDRVYRKGITAKEAIELMFKECGAHFDKKIVLLLRDAIALMKRAEVS
ncbi:MAG: HD domain-containing protein [Syntrophomonadaceae bacterium]|nr:HD domain-containing protein [Syntrophomonadaceae bacterium]